MHRYRSHTCGALRDTDIDQTVRLSGWCHRIRDHGGLLFIDLRDHYGITQCVADPDSPEAKDQLAKYIAAFEDYDMDKLVALFTEDAVFEMPPFDGWYQGPADIARDRVRNADLQEPDAAVGEGRIHAPAVDELRIRPEAHHGGLARRRDILACPRDAAARRYDRPQPLAGNSRPLARVRL